MTIASLTFGILAGGESTRARIATGLTNLERPFLLLSMTCLNGMFQSVWKRGLAESLMLVEGGGAVPPSRRRD
jgi:hypothetical protein